MFENWQAALPFGLRVGHALARRCPLPIDVESAVMEALWKAQTAGAVFSKGYVYLRATGAVRDEMRRVGEGQRGNYQSASAFVDAENSFLGLAAPREDLDELIDRERLLDSMPSAARELVTRLARGEEQTEIARSLGVSAPRINQVTCLLKTNPHAVQRLPGQLDLFEEIRRGHRQMVTRAYAKTGSVTGVAHALGVSVSDSSRWVGQRKLVLPSKWREFPELRERAQRLIRAAFVRAQGAPARAGRLLSIDCSMASALGREFALDVVRSNRRPDITVESIARLCRKGWSQHRIADHFGVSEHAIANRARRDGLPTLLKTRPDLPDSAFAELRSQGLKHREIAERLGVSMPTVCQRLRRAKGLAKCAP